jgi:hypothetical protein
MNIEGIERDLKGIVQGMSDSERIAFMGGVYTPCIVKHIEASRLRKRRERFAAAMEQARAKRRGQ